MFEKFKEDFKIAYKVASTRVKLARKDSIDFGEIRNYILLRNFFEGKNIGFTECFSGILGYAVGTYRHFCPFQYQLNRFDKQVEESEFKSLEINKFSG